ncbi:MAG TPA: hypothetical protein VNU68_34955 [Verrucomicrobiae bacterium]|nr:hypothetical protein [Verrucomicrobiae bacterium]
MTADDIIRANPEYGYEPTEIGGMAGLKGKHPETGEEWWCVYCDNSHVASVGPWTAEQIRSAATNLAGSTGYIDRGHYLKRPTNDGANR